MVKSKRLSLHLAYHISLYEPLDLDIFGGAPFLFLAADFSNIQEGEFYTCVVRAFPN
jgi:hypothetical protein